VQHKVEAVRAHRVAQLVCARVQRRVKLASLCQLRLEQLSALKASKEKKERFLHQTHPA
jgi:hypothetical protein